MSNKPGPSKQSVATMQRDIREVLAEIQRKTTQNHKLLPVRTGKPTISETEASPKPGPSRLSAAPRMSRITEKPGPSSSSIIGKNSSVVTRQPLTDNAYAQELFLRYTNILDIVAKKIPERSAITQRKYAIQHFELYVKQPKMRIREALHEVRFVTRYKEGLFRMVTQMPLTTPDALAEHKQTLARAGIGQLCFVDMTQQNCVLEYQEQVLRKLKSEFQHWGSKLNKLPKYIMACQQIREAENRKFLSLVKHHSTLKGSWALKQRMVLEDLIQEWRLPSEKRRNMVWGYLRFDDDHLNRKYCVANYSKFLFDETIEPDVTIEYSVQSVGLPNDSDTGQLAIQTNCVDRCITPVNDSAQNQQSAGQTIHKQINNVSNKPSVQQRDESSPSVSVPKQPAVETSSESVPQNQQSVIISADAVQTYNETSAAEDTTPKRSTQTEREAVSYSLEYVKKHTNIYEVVMGEFMERNQNKVHSMTQPMLEMFVDRIYSAYMDTFKRNMLPSTIRRLTLPEQKDLAEMGPLAWAKRAQQKKQTAKQKKRQTIHKQINNVSNKPSVQRKDDSCPSVSVPKQPAVETTTENVPQNLQTVIIPADAVQTYNETLAAEAEVVDTTTKRSTQTEREEVSYSLAYVKKHTNIYEVVMGEFMEQNQYKVHSMSQSKLEMFVGRFYSRYLDTFVRHQLPSTIRRLTLQEQKHLAEMGPLAWAQGIELEKQIAKYNKSNNVSVELQTPSQPVVSKQPQSVPAVPTHRPAVAHEPKAKQQKKDPILRTAVPARPCRIQYDSDLSTASVNENDIREESDTRNSQPYNQSIAFVAIPPRKGNELKAQLPPPRPNSQQSQESPMPDSQSFAPFASSTQNDTQPYERETMMQPPTQVPPLTQDPLGLSDTTIPPFKAPNPFTAGSSTPTTSNTSPPAVPISQDIVQTPSYSSSVIPPFQVVNEQQQHPPDSTPPENIAECSFAVKQEVLIESTQDTSGYEDYVVLVPNTESCIIYINDSEDVLTSDTIVEEMMMDPITARANALVDSRHTVFDEVFLSCTDATTNSSLEGRRNLAIKMEAFPISPPRIGRYISFESRRTRNRPPLTSITLATTKATSLTGPCSHFAFLTRIDIQSVRFSKYPTIWPHCSVFQHNPLTININPPCEGIFSVPVRDQQACQLVGLSAGGKGCVALLAALEHAGKFRYGAKEPSKEYYRQTITEKVLALFFATVPACPLGGGLVMYFNSKSGLPADGDEVQLERFNYFTHTKQPQLQQQGAGKEGKETCLTHFMMPGIAHKMKALRETLLKTS